jgi:hypothetical protein
MTKAVSGVLSTILATVLIALGLAFLAYGTVMQFYPELPLHYIFTGATQ